MNELKAQLKNGNRVELEQLAAGLVVHGTIVQRGTVTRSDMTTADVTFAALPPSGKYRFVLAGRNGADSAFGVSMGKKIVEVVNG